VFDEDINLPDTGCIRITDQTTVGCIARRSQLAWWEDSHNIRTGTWTLSQVCLVPSIHANRNTSDYTRRFADSTRRMADESACWGQAIACAVGLGNGVAVGRWDGVLLAGRDRRNCRNRRGRRGCRGRRSFRSCRIYWSRWALIWWMPFRPRASRDSGVESLVLCDIDIRRSIPL
jgi:hypothetical protein